MDITHSSDSNGSPESCVCYDKKPDEDGEEIAENAKLSFL